MRSHPGLIKVRSFHDGANGSLSVVEAAQDIPFCVCRIYYIFGVEAGRSRGYHGHKHLYQLLVCLHGSVDLLLCGAEGEFTYHLDDPTLGLLIPPGYWREMHNFTPDTVILVLASEDFSEADYIRDRAKFDKWLAEQKHIDGVPYLDLSRQPAIIKRDIELAATRVLRSGQYINGLAKARFEREFAALCGVRHAIGVGNGLEAIVLILRALGVTVGDEVLVCAAGFIATPLAVSQVGARPVFVDCDSSGNISPAAIEAAATPRCKAILLTHLYGQPADMDDINAVAAKLGLVVIEDACQAHGARYKGRACGGLGTAAAFSFYPTKNLGALGDGGCVTTDDDALAEHVVMLANYGAKVKYHHEMLGTNSRLDELQAAILSAKLPHLAAWNARRRMLADIYLTVLRDLPGMTLPTVAPGTEPVWHVFPVQVHDGRRDELAAFLGTRGVDTNIHYPCALHRQQCYRAEYSRQSFPQAEALAAEELSLPLTATHSAEEIHYVAKAMLDFFNAGARS